MSLKKQQKTVLFLDKRLLFAKRDKAIRGAEQFNLSLARDLIGQGFSLTIVAARSWAQHIKRLVPGASLELVEMPDFRVAWPNSLFCLTKLIGRRFDVLLLGNVGRCLALPAWLMHKLGFFSRSVLLAHRQASSLFLRILSRVPTTVVAVNNTIARPFSEYSFDSVNVHFGIINSSNYFPALSNKPNDGLVHFIVFGNLDSSWKGSDTAVKAFRMLPPRLRSKLHLHLASFVDNPPDYQDGNITLHPWLNTEQCATLLRRMDVLIVPSRDTNVMKETFCQSLVQGMLTGLPVIANDLPVLKEKLNRGGGLIFRSVEELAQHIETLASDPKLRSLMGELAQDTARTRYIWHTEEFVSRFLFPEAKALAQTDLSHIEAKAVGF